VHALLLAYQQQPDIFLQDYSTFFTEDRAFYLKLHSVSPHTQVLLFYDSLNQAEVLDALEGGARGCLPFTSPPSLYIKAMRAVHGGDIWLSRKDMAMAIETLLHKHHHQTPVDETLPHQLSEREREIARHMGNGLSNKEIAHHLGISHLTVKSHLKHIFHKLKISRRHQLGIAPSSTSRQ
jgi:DNA-binding NarL/FixJ family response regulator